MERSTPQLARKLALEARDRLKAQAKRVPDMKARFLAGPPATTPPECLERHGRSFSLADPLFEQLAPCSRETCACTWTPDVSAAPYGFKRTTQPKP